MKHMKKIMALIIAAVMIMGTMSLSSFAAPGDLDNYKTLTVSGLTKDDTVEYYQILAWDQQTDPANGWVFGSGIDATKAATNNITPSDIYGTKDRENKITFDMAGKIGNSLGTKMTSPASPAVDSNGVWTVTGVEPGLYMVVVTSGTPGVVYNPIFVSSNFYGPQETGVNDSSWVVTSDASYADKAQAKKTEIPLTKEVTGNTDYNGAADSTEYTTDIGEVVSYKVSTTIPKFGANYVKPVFDINDKLTGLKLETAPVVKVGNTTLTAGTEYTLDPPSPVGGKEYTIIFDETYLRNLTGPTSVEVTYDARVDETAEKSVNQENNTVTLSFSANPSDTTGKAKLKDETNHYTFSLDAELFGDKYSGESGSEAIKVGKDKDGNYILESKEYHNYGTKVKHAALEGATFKLYTDEDCQNLYKDGNGDTRTAVTDEWGRITMKGLDTGTYWLKEESAPKGWIKAQKPVKVVIDAVINENVTVTDEYDVDGTKVTTTHVTNELTSYTVTVGGSTTTYQMENSANAQSIEISNITPNDKEIDNTKGVELPSTGGIGTTIFYIIGAILVIGSGVLLVTKRRMNAAN